MTITPQIEEEILLNVIKMQMTPVGRSKDIKMLVLSDKLKELGFEIPPEELKEYFYANFDIKMMEQVAQMYQPETVQPGMVKNGDGSEDNEEMVESGQEEPLPKTSHKRAAPTTPTPGISAASGSSSSAHSKTGTPRRKTTHSKK
jgi:hypothetical protein